jgi:hypothetical protein
MIRKILSFQGGDYEGCRFLGYKIPVRTSQETYYISATYPSRLILCRIWDFHGGDYEECRLLGNKNPDLTSQETHSRRTLWKMPSSGLLRRVALVRIDVSEERRASIVFIRCVQRWLVNANVVRNSVILVTMMMEAIRSSETFVPTRATRRSISEDDILQFKVC